MAEFKSSTLIERLDGMLSEDARAFVDACMDDFFADEVEDTDGAMFYELRGMLTGWYNGKRVSVTQIYYSDIDGMAALIEHLALGEKNKSYNRF